MVFKKNIPGWGNWVIWNSELLSTLKIFQKILHTERSQEAHENHNRI